MPELITAEVERTSGLLPDLVREPRDVGAALERREDPPDQLRGSRHPEAVREREEQESDASPGQSDDDRGPPADGIGHDSGGRFEQEVRALQYGPQQHQLERTESESQDEEDAEDHAHHPREEPVDRHVCEEHGDGAHASVHPSVLPAPAMPGAARASRTEALMDLGMRGTVQPAVTRREEPDAKSGEGR